MQKQSSYLDKIFEREKIVQALSTLENSTSVLTLMIINQTNHPTRLTTPLNTCLLKEMKSSVTTEKSIDTTKDIWYQPIITYFENKSFINKCFRKPSFMIYSLQSIFIIVRRGNCNPFLEIIKKHFEIIIKNFKSQLMSLKLQDMNQILFSPKSVHRKLYH